MKKISLLSSSGTDAFTNIELAHNEMLEAIVDIAYNRQLSDTTTIGILTSLATKLAMMGWEEE